MTKISLTDLVNLQNETTAVNAINTNNSVLETAFDNTLSRDGTSPNTMSANLDMNSHQILNLPAPTTTNSPARLIDVVSNPTITIPGTGTSGHVVPFLDGNNTFSGTQTFSTAPVFPAGSITDASLATQGAFTLLGNNTGSTASPVPVDIAALSVKASPATTDLVMISDQAASGAWKKATLTSLGGVAGVTSIAGNTGAFTLGNGLTNSTNSILTSLTTASNILGADVNLNNTGTYFDGPSMAQGTVGTWLVFGSVTLVDTVSANFSLRLTDGSTIVSSAALFGAAGENISVQIAGIFVNPVANIKITVNDGTNTSGKIVFNRTANSKDSYIWGVRIA